MFLLGVRPIISLVVGVALLAASPASVRADEWNDLCDAVEKQSTTASETIAQKKYYCDSAKGAEEKAKANSIMWKLWAGVAGVCSAACVASFAGFYNQYICMGVNATAGVADAIITKQYITAMTSLASVGGSYLLNKTINKGAGDDAPAGAPPKKEKDIGACVSAALAGVNVVMKRNEMKSAEGEYRSLLDAIKTMPTSDPGTSVAGYGTTAVDAPANQGSDPMGATTGTTANEGGSDETTAKSASPCASAKNSQTVGGYVMCAAASDSNLAGFISNPKFQKDFKKASGMEFTDFMNKEGSPAQMISMASGAALNAGQTAKLAAAVNDAEQQMPHNPNAVYTQGGGGGGLSGGGGDDMALGAMMEGLMNQLNPQQGGAKTAPGVSAVAFANKHRGPSAVVEDTKLNIFDRITYRYYFVGRRMVDGGGR